jgi:hypothetical protein
MSLQRSLSKKTRLRLNGGILFSGNETTGVVGLKTRGIVFTGGGSLVKQFTTKLQLGVELTGAMTQDFQLGKGQLQTLLGGNYQVRDNMSFDFGILRQIRRESRVGVQPGISIDF